MHELFKQCEGEVGRGIDHGVARAVPASAINSCAFAIDLTVSPECQTPDTHLFDDPMRDSSEDCFDDSAALLGIEQGKWCLAAEGAVLVAQPAV